jgi:hypothetical protein
VNRRIISACTSLLALFLAIGPMSLSTLAQTDPPPGTYTDPDLGYTLQWDPDAFQAPDTSVGFHLLIHETGQLLFGGGNGDTADACVNDRVYADSIPPTLEFFTEQALDIAPSVPAVGATATVTWKSPDQPAVYAWFGCAPLVNTRGEPRGFLLLRLLADVDVWPAAVAAFQPVLDSLELPTANPAWTNSVVGESFTHPTDGWSVYWQPNRFEPFVNGSDVPTGIHLFRTGTVEYGDVSTFAGTARECVKDFANYFETYDGMISFEKAADLHGPSSKQSGAESGIWRFTWKSSLDGNPIKTAVEWVICVPAPGQADVSVQVSFSTSEDLFKSTRKGWQTVLNSLTWPGAEATPVARTGDIRT